MSYGVFFYILYPKTLQLRFHTLYYDDEPALLEWPQLKQYLYCFMISLILLIGPVEKSKYLNIILLIHFFHM